MDKIDNTSLNNSLDIGKKAKRIKKKVEEIVSMRDLACDPNGSYTGVPTDPMDMPVQDVDDL